MKKYRLGDIAPIKQGTVLDSDSYWLLNLDMVESNTGRIIDYIYVPKYEIGASTVSFDTGNVLYSKLRPYLNKVVIPQKSGYATSEMLPMCPDTSILTKEYLAYFLRSPRFVRYINGRTSGAKMPRANTSDLKNMDIECPSITEQRRVTSVLEDVSGLIELRQQQLQKLDELVKARFVEMFGDPISNPMNWNKRTLKEVCTKLNDGTHFSPESFSMGDYKYITAKNIKASGFDFSNITYVPEAVHRPIFERCNPEQGDVLYIKDGATTGIAIVNTLKEEFTLLSSVALLKQNRNVINGYFLAALLNNADMYSDIRNNMGGAAITRLTIAKLNVVKVIVPPLDLQNRFAAFVEQADKSKVVIQKALDEARVLFDSLMQQYFG